MRAAGGYRVLRSRQRGSTATTPFGLVISEMMQTLSKILSGYIGGMATDPSRPYAHAGSCKCTDQVLTASEDSNEILF